ncbi:MAG: aldo/keto reductase [Candidatus Aminicenantaceae bacterium]
MNKKTISRRQFITTSTAGMAGVFCLSTRAKFPDKNQGEYKLVYRTLGKTGMRVPVIGMGILSAATPALMQAALDAGITHFDSTASLPQQMRNEEMIGEVLKGRPRDSFIFGTKIRIIEGFNEGLYSKEVTEAGFLKKLDDALKRLQMDYVDILYHHMVERRESAFYEPIMNAMEKAKKAGKAHFHGITTHTNMPEVVQAAADSNFYEVVMTSYNNRQKNHVQVKKTIAKAAKAGLGVVAIKVIRGDLEKGQKPVNSAASLKWVLQDPNVHATIPGFSNYEEMRADLSVMEDLSLTDAERLDLERAATAPDLYCQGCGQCLQHCTAELPIPNLMRAYMYVYGYHQPALAQSLVESLNLPPHLCEECASCPIICQNQWNVQSKIQDIIRLMNVP